MHFSHILKITKNNGIYVDIPKFLVYTVKNKGEMNMITRFFASIIRLIAKLTFVVGIILIIGGALGDRSVIVYGVIMAVVSFGVIKFTQKTTDKKKTQSASKCKKCGASMQGARYEYKCDLSRASKNAYDGLMHATVVISAYCPNCGKVKDIVEDVYFAGSSSKEEIEASVEEQINDITYKYFGH